MSSDVVTGARRGCGSAGKAGVRWNGNPGDDDRIWQVVQPARSLSRHVAVEQLRHCLRDGVRRHLHCLPIHPFRPVDHRAQRAARPGGARHHGLSRHLNEHRDGHGRQRRTRCRGRRYDPLHQSISTRGRSRREHRRSHLDRHRSRGTGIADDRNHQQLRICRAVVLRGQADRLVRRTSGPDHGHRLSRRSLHPSAATIKLLPNIFGAEALRRRRLPAAA